jgi:hypothetical protein
LGWVSWLLFAGSILPALVALRIQKKHWINIPIWDEWDTPGTALLRFAEGNLTWADLFAQHNESRKAVPRLIHIAIASIGGWDVRQGMALTILCACAVSVIALVYLRRRNAPPARIAVAWLVINLLLFAPSQYENFLSGFVFEIFIPFLCLFACCAINLSGWPLPRKTAFASLLALISSYTFAHGLLLWPFALPLPSREDRSRGRGFLLLCYTIYALVGIAAIAGYFIGYRRPEIFPPPAGPRQIGQVFDFILVWLGGVVHSPFVNARVAGTTAGLVMLATVAGAFVALRKNRNRWPAYYPWLLLLAFALASGAVTAVGRVNIGVESVFNLYFVGFAGMRYNVTAVFVYVAVVGLLFNLYEDEIRGAPRRRWPFLVAAAASLSLFAFAWAEMFADESVRVKQFQANRRRARTAAIWSGAIPDNPEIFLAYPYPDRFGKRVEALRAAAVLNLPKPSRSLQEAIAQAPAAADSSAGKLTLFEDRGHGYYRFAGWARNPAGKSAADYVVLGWQEADNSFHPFTAISTGLMRPEVATIYGASSLKSGFDQEIEFSKFPAGPVTIKAWAIDWDTQQAFPMDASVRLPH